MINKFFKYIHSFVSQIRAKKFPTDSLNDDNYKVYLDTQINQSIRKINKDASFRYNLVLSALTRKINPKDKKVLCVGCRNFFELAAFEEVGFKNVTGIDLFSNNKKILVMDMHDMKFQDEVFDVLYSADNLEHSYDPNVVATNFLRVVKKGGYLCVSVPIGWVKTLGVRREDISKMADRIDFANKKEVYDLFGNEIVVEHEEFYLSPDGVSNLLFIAQKK